MPLGALKVEGAIPGSPVAVREQQAPEICRLRLGLAGLRRVTSRDSLDQSAAPPFFSQGTGQGRISVTSVQCLGVESQGGGLKLGGPVMGKEQETTYMVTAFRPCPGHISLHIPTSALLLYSISNDEMKLPIFTLNKWLPSREGEFKGWRVGKVSWLDG